MIFARALWFLLVGLAMAMPYARAELTRIEIMQRSDVLGGKPFGSTGAYEWVEGRAHFSLNANNPRNHNITDLQLAPRDAGGHVTFTADIAILQPKAPARANGVALIDVVNHGERTVPRWLMLGDGGVPALGDAWLLNQGVTLVWLGWQQDLPERRELMRLTGPVLEGVTGWVMGEFVVDQRVADVVLPARFPVADRQAQESVLALSSSRTLAPRVIPGDFWAFARVVDGQRVGDNARLTIEEGFVPGAWYTYAYRAVNPVVTGLGLAALRDTASWLRRDAGGLIRAKWVYAFGVDQGARLLQQFLHEGFNADEAARPAFDALLIHGAGASRLGFNERFAQPSGTLASRVLAPQALSAIQAPPKVFFTTTAWDYWGGGVSHALTTVDGADVPLPSWMRVYHYAGAPHAAVPPSAPVLLPPNPLDVRPGLRALYATLDEWVRVGAAPVASRYPLVAARELVSMSDWDPAAISTIPLPREPWPLFEWHGGDDKAAPALAGPRPVLVPQLDTGGNELAGIRLPALNAPLATHMGWNLRAEAIGAPHELLARAGGAYPLARTREERNTRDPRGVVTEHYGSRAGYLKSIAAEAASLVNQRLLLREDLPRITETARAMWDAVAEGRFARRIEKP
jgi:hypothetical protein